MPKLPEPNPDLTREQALTMILSSIALEEAALAHIMNAEGEKIQHVLNQTRCGDHTANVSNILEVNKSVTNLLEMVQQNQIILKNKMEKVLEHLPHAPCLPDLPHPPISDCATPGEMPACFYVFPKIYRCHEPLLWSGKNVCDSSKIQLPPAKALLLGFYAEVEGAAGCPHVLELIVACKGANPIRIKMTPGRRPCHSGFFKQTVVEMPRPCGACYASVFVRAPQDMCIKKGGFFFVRFQADFLRAGGKESV